MLAWAFLFNKFSEKMLRKPIYFQSTVYYKKMCCLWFDQKCILLNNLLAPSIFTGPYHFYSCRCSKNLKGLILTVLHFVYKMIFHLSCIWKANQFTETIYSQTEMIATCRPKKTILKVLTVDVSCLVCSKFCALINTYDLVFYL